MIVLQPTPLDLRMSKLGLWKMTRLKCTFPLSLVCVCVCTRMHACTSTWAQAQKHACSDLHICLSAPVRKRRKKWLETHFPTSTTITTMFINSNFILLLCKGLLMCPTLQQTRWCYVEVLPSLLQEPEYLSIADFCLISFGLAVFNWLSFVII